ncbi:MAG: type III pantothenate kinase [Kiritimatiellae bacterium]|nr:type III pantothenate kinase [Kiritimatiellia bacterium]
MSLNRIVIDIGNTSTAVALAVGKRITHVRRVTTATAGNRDIRSVLGPLVRRKQVCGTVVSSVVPSVTPLWMSEVYKLTGRRPLVVSHRLRFGLTIDYPKPETIGADRLANVCGAAMRYGLPVIVMDFGTATTFDVVTCDGRFVGGVICPGPLVMTDYLAERTALLPRIRLDGLYGFVGRSTVEAMRIGACVGYPGLVRAVLNHVRQYPGTKGAKLCATGGLGSWVVKRMDIPILLAVNLTLYGLACIYDLNVEAGGGRD